MADTFVQLASDGTGKKMDTRTEGTNSEHRQVMVIGDPATNAGVAPVDSIKGLAVDLTNTGANATAIKVDNSAVTQPISGTITANLGTLNGAALDASVTGLQVSQGSTSSGQKGNLVQGAVTTAAPTYTTAQTSPLSLTTTGALRVDNSAQTQPVSGTITANAGTGTFTIQSNASVNLAQVAGSSISQGHGTAAAAIRVELPTDGTGVVNQGGTWTVQPGNTANTTPWLANPVASASGGYTPGKLICAASTNATSVKASAGTVGYITASNNSGTIAYLKLYDKSSAPTVGTDTPVQVFIIPANTSGAGTNIPLPPQGMAFSSGIAFAVTTGIADADTTAVAASTYVINYGYK